MKSKPKKQQQPEMEDDDVEVDAGGPEIASARKSKVVMIAVSTLLTLIVVYIFFVNNDAPKENLEIIQPPPPVKVAESENGKSPFELEEPKTDSSKVDVDILDKPSTPELPSLPELPSDAVTPDKIDLTQEQKPVDSKTQEVTTNQQPTNEQPPQTQQQQPPVNSGNIAQTPPDQKADPRYAPIVVFSGATSEGLPARGVGYDNNIVGLNQDPIQNLQKTTTAIVATRIDDLVHTIAQGKLLTAVLETAINTELPGAVRAIISRDVFGESGNEILIPKGSRLFGTYSSKINRGQGRVEINWTRLIRPDGVDMKITFKAADKFGRSGLSGDVDNRYNSVIVSSMLTSVLAVGGVAAAQKLLTNNSTTTTTTNPTQGSTTTTGSATNQALYDVTKTIIDTVGQLISSTLDLTPIIRVPQGTGITVIVTSDITVPSMKRR